MLSNNSSSVFDPLRSPLLDLESIETNVDSKDENRADIGVTLWRWWILLQYSLLTFNQGWYWDIPGPIFLDYASTYNVSEDTLQLFVNYGSIFFLLFSLPIAFLLDRPNGFRAAVIISAGCNLSGCILRLLSSSTSFTSILLLHASYIVNAIGAPVAISAPALLANSWFPAAERGLATGIAVACNTFGLVFSFFIGPIMVPSPGFDGIKTYMYVCAASAAFNFICIVVYFPSKPLLPPSISAAVYARANADNDWQSAKSHVVACVKNRTFVILALSYGVIGGLYSGWSALESPNLSSFGVSESAAGLVSGSSIFVAAAAAVALGGYTDRKKNHKQTLVVLLLVGMTAVVVWSLMHHRVVPLPTDDLGKLSLLSVLSVLVAVGFYSCTPIFFEAAIEASHPLPQGGVIMLMTIVFNAASIAMLAIPAEGTAFNWLLSGAALLVTVFMITRFENQNNRSKLEGV